MKATISHLFGITSFLIHYTTSSNKTSSSFDGQQPLCDLGCICAEQDSDIDLSFLDCERKNIVHLPPQIQFRENVTAVSFENNRITTIFPDTFVGSPHVEELDLSFNSIRNVSNNAFLPFKSLTLLRLSYNVICHIPLSMLEGLSDLRVLELGHNKIATLYPRIFQPVSSLVELRLQYNKIKNVEETIFAYLPKLEKLDLEHNELMTVPDNLFSYIPRLHWLTLAKNAFQEVPKEALRKAALLKFLDMSANNFTVLPPEAFSSLNNLTLLYLNHLKHLMRIEKCAFSGLEHLKTLSCSYNHKLNFIDSEAFMENSTAHSKIMHHPSEQLFLRQNALTSLPAPSHLETWSDLEYVDLRGNYWKCDCNIRWMKKLRSEITSMIRCDSPDSLQGKMIDSIPEEEFICVDHWRFSTLFLVVTSLLAFVICSGTALVVICSRSPMALDMKIKKQFSYSKVPPKHECVDLEWDPSADS